MHTPSNRIRPCGELMPPGLFGSTTIDCSACMEKQPPAGRPVDARHAIKATSIPVSTFTRPIASRANNCRFRFTPVELGKYQNRSQTIKESPCAAPAPPAIDRGWVRLRVDSSTLPSIDTPRQVATNHSQAKPARLHEELGKYQNRSQTSEESPLA